MVCYLIKTNLRPINRKQLLASLTQCVSRKHQIHIIMLYKHSERIIIGIIIFFLHRRVYQQPHSAGLQTPCPRGIYHRNPLLVQPLIQLLQPFILFRIIGLDYSFHLYFAQDLHRSSDMIGIRMRQYQIIQSGNSVLFQYLQNMIRIRLFSCINQYCRTLLIQQRSIRIIFGLHAYYRHRPRHLILGSGYEPDRCHESANQQTPSQNC